ncbi:MAG: hypothetical protein D6814_07980, partial [Calditrichaeota bacterium]
MNSGRYFGALSRRRTVKSLFFFGVLFASLLAALYLILSADFSGARRPRGTAALLAGQGQPGLYKILLSSGPCDTSIADTQDGMVKPNQSKIFFHDNTWWMIAQQNSTSDWAIWRYESGRSWTAVYQFNTSSKEHPDAVVDYNANKLYVLWSGNSSSSLWKFSYDSVNRTWNKLSEISLPTVHTINGDPAALIRTPTGDLWAFMAANNEVTGIHSADDGANWSTITLANNLTAGYGLVDAVVFTDTNGVDYLGVGVGEDTDTAARFHFYLHALSAPETLWVDESDQVGPIESEQSDDHICMAVDRFNNVYMITKNHGSGPINSLYVRHPDSTWNAYKVMDVDSWTRPAVIVDNSHDTLYVFGSRTNDRAEYKKCKIGEESTLVDDNLRTPLMEEGGDYFVNLSVAFHAVYDSTELMVLADNSDQGDVWFSWLPIGSSSGCPFQPIDTTIYNFTISKSGSDVVLDWTAVARADSYVVYRGLTPMFSADTARYAVVTTNTFTDTSALGDPD